MLGVEEAGNAESMSDSGSTVPDLELTTQKMVPIDNTLLSRVSKRRMSVSASLGEPVMSVSFLPGVLTNPPATIRSVGDITLEDVLDYMAEHVDAILAAPHMFRGPTYYVTYGQLRMVKLPFGLEYYYKGYSGGSAAKEPKERVRRVKSLSSASLVTALSSSSSRLLDQKDAKGSGRVLAAQPPNKTLKQKGSSIRNRKVSQAGGVAGALHQYLETYFVSHRLRMKVEPADLDGDHDEELEGLKLWDPTRKAPLQPQAIVNSRSSSRPAVSVETILQSIDLIRHFLRLGAGHRAEVEATIGRHALATDALSGPERHQRMTLLRNPPVHTVLVNEPQPLSAIWRTDSNKSFRSSRQVSITATAEYPSSSFENAMAVGGSIMSGSTPCYSTPPSGQQLDSMVVSRSSNNFESPQSNSGPGSRAGLLAKRVTVVPWHPYPHHFEVIPCRRLDIRLLLALRRLRRAAKTLKRFLLQCVKAFRVSIEEAVEAWEDDEAKGRMNAVAADASLERVGRLMSVASMTLGPIGASPTSDSSPKGPQRKYSVAFGEFPKFGKHQTSDDDSPQLSPNHRSDSFFSKQQSPSPTRTTDSSPLNRRQSIGASLSPTGQRGKSISTSPRFEPIVLISMKKATIRLARREAAAAFSVQYRQWKVAAASSLARAAQKCKDVSAGPMCIYLAAKKSFELRDPPTLRPFLSEVLGVMPLKALLAKHREALTKEVAATIGSRNNSSTNLKGAADSPDSTPTAIKGNNNPEYSKGSFGVGTTDNFTTTDSQAFVPPNWPSHKDNAITRRVSLQWADDVRGDKRYSATTQDGLFQWGQRKGSGDNRRLSTQLTFAEGMSPIDRYVRTRQQSMFVSDAVDRLLQNRLGSGDGVGLFTGQATSIEGLGMASASDLGAARGRALSIVLGGNGAAGMTRESLMLAEGFGGRLPQPFMLNRGSMAENRGSIVSRTVPSAWTTSLMLARSGGLSTVSSASFAPTPAPQALAPPELHPQPHSLYSRPAPATVAYVNYLSDVEASRHPLPSDPLPPMQERRRVQGLAPPAVSARAYATFRVKGQDGLVPPPQEDPPQFGVTAIPKRPPLSEVVRRLLPPDKLNLSPRPKGTDLSLGLSEQGRRYLQGLPSLLTPTSPPANSSRRPAASSPRTDFPSWQLGSGPRAGR